MKTVINIVLALCAAALIYVCYESILGPIRFDEQKKERDKVVVARLIDIRRAQQEFRMQNQQRYTASFDTLIDFVKNGRIAFVAKEGTLDDKQLEDGLTEAKAMAIISKAKKTGNYKDVEKNRLQNFRRDTMWVAVIDTLYPQGFVADSMRYVPFGNGAQFEMKTRDGVTQSGAPMFLLEVKTPYNVYLNGLDKQEIANLNDIQTKLNKYPGLMFGSIEIPNNNAGNWE